MIRRPTAVVTALSLLLAACGGSGGGSGGTVSVAQAPSATATPSPTPAATPAATCSLRDRQDWAAAQLREWYLFPETLPASLDPTPFTSVGDYVDALTATARSQRRDRYFTYVTSIEAENAYYNSGATAGFGFRLSTNAAQRRVFIAEAFEGSPALAAGIDRGAELLAVGTPGGTLTPVADLIASGGSAAVTNALGPNTAGTTRLLRIADAAGTREVSVAKADYTLDPVSSRYGAKIIEDGGRRYGYVNLRTFISTAETPLRSAFASFRSAGITDIIVDFRYNGGGLVSIAELMSDLMGRARATSDVVAYTTYRAEKAASNRTRYFASQPQAIAPTRVAFIGTGSTASASELVINAALPYLRGNAALIGANTYGKPVGQVALDRASCDDRLRVIAFATQNANRQGDYYDGLASKMEATCQASDDITRPLGDPQEASTRAALNFLQGKACAPIGSAALTQAARAAGAPRELLTPERPDTMQREVPGAF